MMNEKYNPFKYITEKGKERFNACEELKPYYDFMCGTYTFSPYEYIQKLETINTFLGLNADWKLEGLGCDGFVLYDTNDF